MPKLWDEHYEAEQDWEDMVFTKSKTECSDKKMVLHERIKSSREKQNIFQSDLASHLNIDLIEYQKMENGVVPLGVDSCAKICRFLNIKI